MIQREHPIQLQTLVHHLFLCSRRAAKPLTNLDCPFLLLHVSPTLLVNEWDGVTHLLPVLSHAREANEAIAITVVLPLNVQTNAVVGTSSFGCRLTVIEVSSSLQPCHSLSMRKRVR